MQRTQLDAELRAQLPASTREAWPRHANYAQGAKHLQDIHRAMLANSEGMTRVLTALAEGHVATAQIAAAAKNAHDVARHVVDHLHTHHRIEDEQLFPQFARWNPKISRPLALLEADHRVLNAAGSVLDQALRSYPKAAAQATEYARVAQAAAQLDRVMRRHIADEEDIVIPAYLGLR
ncbi:MAG: hemerythrin domain-containing protein [Gammaproteobacteria bacterium]|nr:MAG: hemerythrin domain-containing protein [Gammaproteobacteria bacterium]